jgi:ubiquitin C-terminal hydrolase
LCIVLERKKQDGGSINSDGGRINSSVNFPVSGFSITEDHLQYNLVGTVHHKPDGHEHGHYTSICHSQRSHDWYLYDDEHVSYIRFVNKLKKDRVLKQHTKTATILFYELQTHDGSEDIIDLQSNDTDGSCESSRFSAS